MMNHETNGDCRPVTMIWNGLFFSFGLNLQIYKDHIKGTGKVRKFEKLARLDTLPFFQPNFTRRQRAGKLTVVTLGAKLVSLSSGEHNTVNLTRCIQKEEGSEGQAAGYVL